MKCRCLAAKSSHVGVNMDGLACPLHHSMACSYQTRGRDIMLGAALSRHATAGGGTFLGGCEAPGLEYLLECDRLGTCVIEFLQGCIIFTSVLLPCGRVIVACMRICLIELPIQTSMRRIPVLVYLLSSVRGFLQPCPISSDNYCYASRGPDVGRAYLVTGALGGVTGRPGPSRVGVREGIQVVKSSPLMPNMAGVKRRCELLQD
jgi:hypothetical protein